MTRPNHSVSSTALLSAVAALCLAPAHAQTIFFGEDLNNSESVRLASHPKASAAQSNFTANLTGTGTETFESFAAGTSAPLTLHFPGSLNTSITAVLSQSGQILSVPTGTTGDGVYPISGSKVLDASGSNFQVDFGSPVAAFGFYGVDIGDYGGELSLQFSSAGANPLTYIVPHTLGSNASTGGSVLYFGLIDTAHPFTRIRFLNSASGDDFGFDDMTVSDIRQVTPVVPEPGAIALLLAGGLSGAGWLLRRQDKQPR